MPAFTTKYLPHAKLLHAHIIKTGGFHCNRIFVANNLISMYAKCGSLEDGHRLLAQMPQQNEVSWTLMISAYAKQGLPHHALSLFYQMQQAAIQPSHFSFSRILTACASLAALEYGKKIHGSVIISGCECNVFVGSGLLDMYMKCGNTEDARQVFDKMPERNVVSWTSMVQGYAQSGDVAEAMNLFYRMPQPDVVSWTAMITALSKHGCNEEALRLCFEMQEAGIAPNQFTFASILPVCANLRALKVGREIHEEIIRRGFQFDDFVGCGLMDMYIKCGNIRDARQVFNKMPRKNVVTWNSMIVGQVQNGLINEARKLFLEMPQQDAVSWTAMISGYAQNGNVDEALKLFEEMPVRDVVTWTSMIEAFLQNGQLKKAGELFEKAPEKDVVSWTVMISGYAQNGHSHEALKLFKRMQQTNLKPDPDNLGSVLLSCSNLAALQHGKEVHEHIIRNGYQPDVFMGNALLDMYAKCGSLLDARKIFDRMPTKDVVSWNAMIAGYAMHGYGKEAVQLFEQMHNFSIGIRPNHVTFIGILSACCHAGLIDDAWRYFNFMSQHYQITPTAQHYCCMVDLLGRAGCLDDAQEFITKMSVKPDVSVLGSLLGACRIHMNIELGEHLAERLFEMDSENPAPYVTLSNMYATAGRWDDIGRLRQLMKGRGVKKKPGCSWLEVNGEVYAFLTGDKSKPQVQNIHVKLDRLSGQMAKAGYAPDTRFVLHNMEDHRKNFYYHN